MDKGFTVDDHEVNDELQEKLTQLLNDSTSSGELSIVKHTANK